ncbi:hypothetical protein PASE110613_17790 [Paenibacillus sediminis]
MMIHRGIVNETVLNRFHNIMGNSLMNNAANTCNIEQHLSVASVLWPEIIEIDGFIFISEFYQGNLNSLNEQFKNDRRQIELFVNSWSIGDFFLIPNSNSIHDDEAVYEFANVLKFFWELRIKDLFLDRKINIELGMGIMGEHGLTITMYQA